MIVWSKTEIKLLKKMYPVLGLTDDLLKQFPNRTKNSVRSKVQVLKLKVSNQRKKDWSKSEVKILKKWYPLLGTNDNVRGKNIIGTPKLMDMLPNRSSNSIRNKCTHLGIKNNHQIDVPKGHKRCILCLEIKTISKFPNDRFFRCKKCKSIIHKSNYGKDYKKRLINNLRISIKTRLKKKISNQECTSVIEKLLEKYGIKCFFEDDYCDNEDFVGLVIGHKKPLSKMRNMDSYRVENLFLLCKLHNGVMSNISFSDLKECMGLMSDKIDRYLDFQ